MLKECWQDQNYGWSGDAVFPATLVVENSILAQPLRVVWGEIERCCSPSFWIGPFPSSNDWATGLEMWRWRSQQGDSCINWDFFSLGDRKSYHQCHHRWDEQQQNKPMRCPFCRLSFQFHHILCFRDWFLRLTRILGTAKYRYALTVKSIEPSNCHSSECWLRLRNVSSWWTGQHT